MEKRVATLYGAATISSVLAIEKIATCESSDVATKLSTILTFKRLPHVSPVMWQLNS